MSQADIAALIAEMSVADRLPRVPLHFMKHRADFEVSTAEEYEQRFLEHIRLRHLRRFTFLRPDTQTKMWYLVDTSTGAVAVYNETRRRHWTFFRLREPDFLLRRARGWWVQVVRVSADWKARAW